METFKELTQAQVDMLPAIRDKWMAIGLATGHGDVELAKRAICNVYRLANLNPPCRWIVCDSPAEGWEAAEKLSGANQNSDQRVWEGGYGNLDADWLAFYDAFIQFGVEEAKSLIPLMQIAQEIGWWWPMADVCILVHRPTAMHRDAEGRLHNPIGPAIDYNGKCKLYLWHGILISPDTINGSLTPEDIINGNFTSGDVLQTRNAEIKRVMIEKIGLDKFFSGLQDVTVRHQDTDAFGNVMQLVKIALPEARDGFLQAIQVVCPSTGRKYFHLVPHEVSTCQEARARMWNKRHGKTVPGQIRHGDILLTPVKDFDDTVEIFGPEFES